MSKAPGRFRCRNLLSTPLVHRLFNCLARVRSFVSLRAFPAVAVIACPVFADPRTREMGKIGEVLPRKSMIGANINVVSKASFDKANRTSLFRGKRGPGVDPGCGYSLERWKAGTAGCRWNDDISTLPEQTPAAPGGVCFGYYRIPRPFLAETINGTLLVRPPRKKPVRAGWNVEGKVNFHGPEVLNHCEFFFLTWCDTTCAGGIFSKHRRKKPTGRPPPKRHF